MRPVTHPNPMIKPAFITAVLFCWAIGGFAQAQLVRPDASRTKSSDALRSVFRSATAKPNKSTVMIKTEEKGITRQVALGTVVSPDGFILTKASEVMGLSKAFVVLATGSVSRNYDLKVIGFSPVLDLAMVKIEATGLLPIDFADTRSSIPDPPAGAAGRIGGPGGPRNGFGQGGGGGGRDRVRGRGGQPAPVVMPAAATAPAPMPGAIAVEVGEWVASSNSAASVRSDSIDEPFAVGVISTNRRRIPGSSGFLGVSMADVADAPGARIMQVIPGSAAEKAGVKVDDLITGVNGTPINNRIELSAAMQRLRPGDLVTLAIERADQKLTLRAALGVYTDASPEEEMQHLLMGSVSRRSGDFPAVYQHDTVIRPVDCGGPLVDLDGHVLGINIARAGRTETYAIPADLILPLIEPMKTGKMPPPGQLNFAGTTKPAATQRE